MKEQVADLGLLESRLQEEIKALEHRLSEAKRKLNVITEAIGLLEKEGILGQENLFPQAAISTKYQGWNMSEAIKDVLKSYQGKKMSAENILSELQRQGFTSNSKNLKRDVYTRLFRLQKRRILGLRKEGGLNKYFLKEERIEEIAEKEKGEI